MTQEIQKVDWGKLKSFIKSCVKGGADGDNWQLKLKEAESFGGQTSALALEHLALYR